MTENRGIYMPIERDRYPSNWPQLTLDLKNKTDWRCTHCGKECRKPGELISQFIIRVYGGIDGDEWQDAADYPMKYVLTTAHLDQNPANNNPNNLASLCTVCHLKHDNPFKKQNAIAKQRRKGQTSLPL